MAKKEKSAKRGKGLSQETSSDSKPQNLAAKVYQTQVDSEIFEDERMRLISAATNRRAKEGQDQTETWPTSEDTTSENDGMEELEELYSEATVRFNERRDIQSKSLDSPEVKLEGDNRENKKKVLDFAMVGDDQNYTDIRNSWNGLILRTQDLPDAQQETMLSEMLPRMDRMKSHHLQGLSKTFVTLNQIEPEQSKNILGNFLKKLRKELGGLNQTQMAELFGLSQSQYSKIERGNGTLNTNELEKFGDENNMDVQVIFSQRL